MPIADGPLPIASYGADVAPPPPPPSPPLSTTAIIESFINHLRATGQNGQAAAILGTRSLGNLDDVGAIAAELSLEISCEMFEAF